MQGKAWDGIVRPPVQGRLRKPRAEGWTMVIDKGLGLAETGDWLELAGDYVDLLKLTFGTSALYSSPFLQDKIGLCRRHGVMVMPGGTLGEVAMVQGNFASFLTRARELGFDALEISDGTIDLDAPARKAAISAAIAAGFVVLSEIGKKDPGQAPALEIQIEQALTDLVNGSRMVIIEGRESGKAVGIYDAAGAIRDDDLATLCGSLPVERIIWEAPQKHQQEALIIAMGPNVNLGNIPPGEALALEALRLGLRGDTLKEALKKESERRSFPPTS